MQKLKAGLDLSREDISKVMAIMLPALLELVLSHLFTMVDTIMLGRSEVSAVAIAAVGLTNNPTNLVRSVLIALNVGTTAGVAWAIGAGDRRSASQIARNALMLNAAVGAAAAALVFVFAGPIVRFMGAGEDTFAYAKEYLQIVAMGMLPLSMTFAVTAGLRGVGQTKLPMKYNLIANMFNVMGNYVLIYGKFGMPKMGVAGAAVSTALSQGLGLVLALYTAFHVDTPVRMRLDGGWRLRLKWIQRILSVGMTSMLEQLIMQVGFIIFARQVSGLGTMIFAAHQIGLSINGLSWMPGQAFGVAATTLTGQSLGAGEKGKATDFVRLIHRMSMISAALIAVLFVLGSQMIASLYTTDPEVIRLSGGVLKLIALGMPGICTQLPIAAGLRGARDTKFPLIASMAGIWIFRVMLAPVFIYTLGWGLTGAWLTIVLDQTTRALVVYARFKTGRWLHVGEKMEKRKIS
ncbi:MAG: MATE family efflux transporter [Clostridia bacterium]|nr:MATE family efflux transporter [Clostridia bacterium]